jgi:hypothetical protein
MNLKSIYIKTLFTAATAKRSARVRATLYVNGCNVRVATIHVDAPSTAGEMHAAHGRAAITALTRARVRFDSIAMENVCLRSRRFTVN